MLKLYYSPGACSLAPHILLEEIGQPYEAQLVSLKDGQQNTPEYRHINPHGRVPVLAVGGRFINENVAIQYYLATAFPEAQLLPADVLETARVLSFAAWLAGAVHACSVGSIWRGARFTDDERAQESIAAKGKATLRAQFQEIEARLGNATFIAGSQFTIADPYSFVFYRWGKRLGFDMAADFPHWTRQAQRVAARPATLRTCESEGIPLFG